MSEKMWLAQATSTQSMVIDAVTTKHLVSKCIENLKRSADRLHELLRQCTLCPHECGAHRLDGKYGVCRTTDEAVVASAGPHFGEEPPLAGTQGSGTIFFASCNLKCCYCQNYDISQMRIGRPVTTSELSDMMLALQRRGCHNINLVTPTHVIPQIVAALVIAVRLGLRVPIVYNCGGYESVRTLQLLEGIVDIYMPDIKYGDNGLAKKYSGAPRYWDVVRCAIREMHRQVGDLQIDDRGITQRGLLVRHLVLPNRIAGSRKVIEFVAKEVTRETYINLMDQYRPAYRAQKYGELSRPITHDEFNEVIAYAHKCELHRGFN